MHPQIVRDGPGACPICGMALEPMTGAGDAGEENPELRDMSRRFWVAAALTVPVLVLGMSDLLPGGFASALVPRAWQQYVDLAIATRSPAATNLRRAS